ncbi:MAG: cytochrome c oxidase cbb3-type subunit 3 [Rickettsiales bacterium]|jgi:cytochrome c oxidase cbb3-type subunit 3
MNKDYNKKTDIKKKPETTGHSWDGVEEYNTPTPRWWLIVWLACTIWAVIYWFFYPTWPTPDGNTKGLKNWTSQSELLDSQAKILTRKAAYLERFNKSSFEKIKQDRELMKFAINGGKSSFQNNCAMCHGTGAAGQKGYPNLNDDNWLWGGKIEDIYTTLRYGIRSGHDKARMNQMPAFGLDKILTRDEIEKVANYVLSLSDNKNSQELLAGKRIFTDNCAACHGKKAQGNRELGAPNLNDRIWLYGGEKEDLLQTIYYSRNGVMPYWSGRLDDATIRQLSIYVHSLGGGE